ncbi:RimK-like ATP-grasp domain protein [Legionella nautarum]|uniref:RimK-like ATP-grasp domain protein n=1 Tax=Legionella nautarum TaxID=45070 RepID=A0A0W0WMM4_9GAMM|nr:hypothetical protein [Legionella nautarum]KTD33581.1 RimK-like ATP-grasp domain protein [Legionella nautarum]
MFELESFIGGNYRPEIIGGRLDENHQTKFILDYSAIEKLDEVKVNAIAFGPKKDKVLFNLEYAIDYLDNILILYYEDIHKRWSYIRTNTECCFLYKKNALEQYKIKPKCLYIRGCQIDPDDKFWLSLGEFYNFVDTWDGKAVCSPKSQNNNESKLYQLNSSLKKASKNKANISIGNSYVIKGRKPFELLPNHNSYIVKSLSGIRSIVVDETEYKNWNQFNLNNLPILFQEKIQGNDLRIHVANGNLHGKLSSEKEKVDYRYDNKFFSLQDVYEFSEELRKFCIEVTSYEDNPLIGIDFIKIEDKYVVLEANPSPGWSAYHEHKGVKKESFISDLLAELKNV